MNIDFQELARQQSTFMYGLGSALFAVMGLIVAIRQVRTDSAAHKLPPGFATRLTILVLLCVAGGHTMGEVAATSEKVSPQDLYQMFTISSVFAFIVAVGFLQTVRALLDIFQKDDGNVHSAFGRVVQGLFLIPLGLYSIIGVEVGLTDPRAIGASRLGLYGWSSIITLLATTLCLIVTWKLSPSEPKVIRRLRDSVLTWLQILGCLASIIVVALSSAHPRPISTGEVIAMLSVLWTIFILALAGTLAPGEDQQVRQRPAPSASRS